VTGDPGALRELVRAELSAPASEAARELAAELQRRHDPATLAVLFYGSCLRKETAEGVLDFYVIVDSYRRAYASRWLAWINAALPPNVFFVEREAATGPLRCKYAVVSARDFRQAAAGRTLRTSIWARFCQPARAVYTRDPEALESVVDAAAQSVRTAVGTLLPLLPARDGQLDFDGERFWQRALRETYAAEMRPERLETVRAVYASAPERFDRAAELALEQLARDGALAMTRHDDRCRVSWSPEQHRRARLTWRLRRPAAKLVYALQLLKSATTFGDWVPYVLWKLERHTGTRLVASPRQRRHPFIYGWPLLFRALWRREFR